MTVVTIVLTVWFDTAPEQTGYTVPVTRQLQLLDEKVEWETAKEEWIKSEQGLNMKWEAYRNKPGDKTNTEEPDIVIYGETGRSQWILATSSVAHQTRLGGSCWVWTHAAHTLCVFVKAWLGLSRSGGLQHLALRHSSLYGSQPTSLET